MSPAGHCPHHEAPEAVHAAMQSWLSAIQENAPMGLGVGESMLTGEKGVRVTHVDGSPRNIFERLDLLMHSLRVWVKGLGQMPLSDASVREGN